MSLPHKLQEDFRWWKSNIALASNPIRVLKYDLEICSDASRSGWGAVCNEERSHGFWNETDRSFHINYLELLAAFLGLKCFAKNLKGSQILLRIDNTTAISYINRMGGIQFENLNQITKEIWKWYERRNLWIFASYISSRMNWEADIESRRLESETEYELSKEAFSEIIRTFGKPDTDLFASRANTKCETYVSWRRDPGAIAIVAFTITWNPYFFYAFPPFSIILRVLQKIKSERSRGLLVVPLWETQPWFPMFKSMLAADTLVFPPDINLLTSCSKEPHPLWGENYPGCRVLIRRAFARKGTPPSAVNIMISSLSEGSIKQYGGAIKKWWRFCVERSIEPSEGTATEVLLFLTKEYEAGASYGSLNTARSAIALLTEGNIALDPRVRRFIKEVINMRPSTPRYDVIWDPKIVLSYFTSLPENEELDLKTLSEKLVTLLALVTGHRIQTFSLINIGNIRKIHDTYEVKIPNRIKTTGPRRKHPVLVLPFFLENSTPCVASALESYIQKTTPLRGTVEYLFLSFKSPYKAVTTQTLSRWIKDMLTKSGVDTQRFTAYSTRHASTSTARRKGVGLDTIRRTAGWTETSSTFSRFYDLRLCNASDQFARSVLSSL